MLIKLLLRIWPALIPITIYVLWVLVVDRILIQKILKKKSKIIDGEYKIVGEKTSQKNEEKVDRFSLQNRHFLIVLYLSLTFGIVALISFAISSPNKNPESYLPAQFKDGKIIPAQIN